MPGERNHEVDIELWNKLCGMQANRSFCLQSGDTQSDETQFSQYATMLKYYLSNEKYQDPDQAASLYAGLILDNPSFFQGENPYANVFKQYDLMASAVWNKVCKVWVTRGGKRQKLTQQNSRLKPMLSLLSYYLESDNEQSHDPEIPKLFMEAYKYYNNERDPKRDCPNLGALDAWLIKHERKILKLPIEKENANVLRIWLLLIGLCQDERGGMEYDVFRGLACEVKVRKPKGCKTIPDSAEHNPGTGEAGTSGLGVCCPLKPSHARNQPAVFSEGGSKLNQEDRLKAMCEALGVVPPSGDGGGLTLRPDYNDFKQEQTSGEVSEALKLLERVHGLGYIRAVYLMSYYLHDSNKYFEYDGGDIVFDEYSFGTMLRVAQTIIQKATSAATCNYLSPWLMLSLPGHHFSWLTGPSGFCFFDTRAMLIDHYHTQGYAVVTVDLDVNGAAGLRLGQKIDHIEVRDGHVYGSKPPEYKHTSIALEGSSESGADALEGSSEAGAKVMRRVCTAVDDAINRKAGEEKPVVLVVSLGTDGHRGDNAFPPGKGAVRFGTNDYVGFFEFVMEQPCKVVFITEGGYDLSVLKEVLQKVKEALSSELQSLPQHARPSFFDNNDAAPGPDSGREGSRCVM